MSCGLSTRSIPTWQQTGRLASQAAESQAQTRTVAENSHRQRLRGSACRSSICCCVGRRPSRCGTRIRAASSPLQQPHPALFSSFPPWEAGDTFCVAYLAPGRRTMGPINPWSEIRWVKFARDKTCQVTWCFILGIRLLVGASRACSRAAPRQSSFWWFGSQLPGPVPFSSEQAVSSCARSRAAPHTQRRMQNAGRRE